MNVICQITINIIGIHISCIVFVFAGWMPKITIYNLDPSTRITSGQEPNKLTREEVNLFHVPSSVELLSSLSFYIILTIIK